jgi:alpha-galactosidase
MGDDRYLVLQGASTAVVLELVEGGAPLWRYWGPCLPGGGLPPAPLMETRPSPSFSLDDTPALSIFPTFGMGWYGQSALLAHREGEDFAQSFTRCTADWMVPGKAVSIKLVDEIAAVEVHIRLSLDGNVLTVSQGMTNTGSAVLEVQWLAACTLPLPEAARSVRSFTGKHNGEFLPQTDMLGRAIWSKENRRGLTSHDAFPGAMVEAEGVSYAAQLAWSGNHVQSIAWLDDGRYQWQLGEWLAPGEVRLAPGETLSAPDVLVTCSANGANGIAQNFHGAIRARLDWPGGAMKPRPVHVNSWEGYYFDHDLPALIAFADAAAETGIERFVLDDGWFHRRDDDRRALGDWWADADKYPGGLAPLANHVTALGMEFGLWVEPEMVNPDSDLFRAHPDWALQIAGRPLITARNQLVLDIARAEVGDYLFETISALLRELPISYLKWDHNRDLAPAGGADGRASYHRQVEAAYALFARFRAAFPNVEIEACAGGGGRIDAGIIRHTHRFWASDCIDAVSRAAMQPGFLRFMPPEIMGSHIGASPAHSTGRMQSMDFRAAVALQGHFGVELDLVKMRQDERDRLGQWISFYKAWRHLLHAQVWTGQGSDGQLWHAAGSEREWLLIVYQIAPMTHRHMPPLQLPFVCADCRYTVAQIGPDGEQAPMIADGGWLETVGLPLPPMMAESAIIYRGVLGDV